MVVSEPLKCESILILHSFLGMRWKVVWGGCRGEWSRRGEGVGRSAGGREGGREGFRGKTYRCRVHGAEARVLHDGDVLGAAGGGHGVRGRASFLLGHLLCGRVVGQQLGYRG